MLSRMAGIACVMALSACAANGPLYSGQHGIVLYRDAPIELDSLPFEVDGKPFCSLKPRSFAVIPAAHATITASRVLTPGVSRYEAHEGEIVHIGIDTVHATGTMLGGLIGGLMAEGYQPTGPYAFTVTDAAKLTGLHQDCM